MEYNSNRKWLVIKFFCCPYFYTSLCPGYIKAQTARQNRARQPDEKIAGSIWLPGLDIAGHLKEVGQIEPDNTRFCIPL